MNANLALDTQQDTCDRRTYTVSEIAQLLGISSSAAYELVKEGRFKSVRIGTSIRVSKKSFDKWLDEHEL
jgi:excisionase family DNA binding protein